MSTCVYLKYGYCASLYAHSDIRRLFAPIIIYFGQKADFAPENSHANSNVAGVAVKNSSRLRTSATKVHRESVNRAIALNPVNFEKGITMKHTMRCSNFCTSPRGARRDRVDFPGAQALKKGLNGRTSAGRLARLRICGAGGHPNLRFPDVLALKRGAKRTGVRTQRVEGRSSRGRCAPLVQSMVDKWRDLRAMRPLLVILT